MWTVDVDDDDYLELPCWSGRHRDIFETNHFQCTGVDQPFPPPLQIFSLIWREEERQAGNDEQNLTTNHFTVSLSYKHLIPPTLHTVLC